MKYLSEKYQKQLEELAEQLVTPERFAGSVAVEPVAQLYLFPLAPETSPEVS